MEADLAYYRRRVADEAAAAAASPDPRVRQVHLDLAALYSARLSALEARPLEAHLQLVSAA